jgi:enamine deaminase RidA (YjgF/YER057c/UK114 family)
MHHRQTITSGSPWEDLVGYSRATRVGAFIEVSGTVAADSEGNVAGPEDPYTQTRYALEKVIAAVRNAGGKREEIVRTRVYIVDFAHYREVARAHRELFGDLKPASTMVQVAALVSPDFLVEVEASAIMQQPPAEAQFA